MTKMEMVRMFNAMRGEERHDYYAVLKRVAEKIDMKGLKFLYHLFFEGKATRRHMIKKLHEHYNWNMIYFVELGSANEINELVKDSEIEKAFDYLEENYSDLLLQCISEYIAYMEDRGLTTCFEIEVVNK